jgi:hypothetical protein
MGQGITARSTPPPDQRADARGKRTTFSAPPRAPPCAPRAPRLRDGRRLARTARPRGAPPRPAPRAAAAGRGIGVQRREGPLGPEHRHTDCLVG